MSVSPNVDSEHADRMLSPVRNNVKVSLQYVSIDRDVQSNVLSRTTNAATNPRPLHGKDYDERRDTMRRLRVIPGIEIRNANSVLV